jgi:beta-galactosidase
MTRRTELLNRSWKFAYGDPPGAVHPDFDDGRWFDVGLPHSFGIPYFMEGGFYVGKGVYRRTIHLEASDVDRYVALEFHGVFQDADVYVNGEPVGRHLGGYTAFVVDISSVVRPGQNLIAVRVSNEWNPRLAPRAGEHVFNGGIYRDVSLIVAENTRIAWYGTGISTTRVDGAEATVTVATELVNDSDMAFTGDLLAEVSMDDNRVLGAEMPVTLAAGETRTVRQEITIPDAHLWHPDAPRLYRLDQSLASDSRPVDHARTEFGVRTVEFTTDDGFFLNGRRLSIHGANVHQDHAGWSDAVTHAGIRRDVALIRECGMNFIRGSHYPHHEQFATECDRQGLLFWSELCFWGTGGDNVDGYWTASAYPPEPADRAEFEESCLQALSEMIRVNRNHPSIIAWSVGNEAFFTDDEVIPEAKKLTRRLVDLAHELDPTRPSAVGGAQRRGFDELGDIAGYNGDGASLFHAPPWPNMVSEYGCVMEERPGVYGPRYSHGVEIEHRWRSGIALWCGFHHGSILPGMGSMGFIDYFRVPLRSWYWYRHALRGVDPPPWPVSGTATAIRLTADRTTIRTDGTDDAQLRVELLDETGRVVADDRPVTIDVVDGGGIFPTGTSIELSARNRGLLDGHGAIEFRSYYSGTNVLRAHADGLQPATLHVEAIGGEPWTGQDRRLSTGPPSLTHPPAGNVPKLLSADRPVFSSGYRSGSPASLVTDYRVDRGWISDVDQAGTWAHVDLEAAWHADVVTAMFGAGVDVPFVIETSSGTGGGFTQVATGTTGRGSAVVVLGGRTVRAVRVVFPGSPAELIEVRVHGR